MSLQNYNKGITLNLSRGQLKELRKVFCQHGQQLLGYRQDCGNFFLDQTLYKKTCHRLI